MNDAKTQITEVKNTLTEMGRIGTAGRTSEIIDSVTALIAALEQ